jgi:hypothetical protein
VPTAIDGVAAEPLVRRLLTLHETAEDPAAGDELAQAMAATNRFARYYHHAAPFDRAALAAVWRRCERRPELAARCREKRAVAERVLGELGREVARRDPAD